MEKTYNPETNTTSGSSKKTVYLQGSEPENKIITLNKDLTDASGNPIPSMQHAKAKIDVLALKKEIKDYNDSLKTITDADKSFVMNGNILVVRLYQHDPYIMNKENPNDMLFYNPITIPYKDTTDGGAIKGMESPLQYLNRGIIVNMSGQYSEFFKQNFKVGDVVDIKLGASLMLARFWVSPEQYIRQEFDNYFSFNENMIEKKILK